MPTPYRTPQKPKAGGTPKSRPKAGSGGGGGAAKKGAKGKNGAAGGKEDGEAPAKKTRKPSTVMWRVSDELAAVVGSNEGTVDTIRTGVYGYIKAHNLQVSFVRLGSLVYVRAWHLVCLLEPSLTCFRGVAWLLDARCFRFRFHVAIAQGVASAST